MRHVVLAAIAASPIVFASPEAAAQSTRPAMKPSARDLERLAAEVEQVLRKDVLDKWLPAAVDRERGGFHQDFAADWQRIDGPSERDVVYQSRLTWLAAQAAAHVPERAEEYRAIARHGIRFLAEKQWDRENGGFFWSVDPAGKNLRGQPDVKHTYGIAFAIYASATTAHLLQDATALDLAKRAFEWLDARAHDDANGGYFEALAADGEAIAPSTAGNDVIGTRFGRKSMNTHIHVLEALVALHHAAPDDERVKRRLREIYEIVAEKIYSEPGHLTLYFDTAWRRVPGHDSFGHDVETAYLLVEAAVALGHGEEQRAWTRARALIDHALEVGYDTTHGGLYDEGTPAGGSLNTRKVWWVQAESLNALLMMHARFAHTTDRYWIAWQSQWAFITRHQIDPVHGGWLPSVAADGRVEKPLQKSDTWTEGYHQGRALLNVSQLLRRLAREAAE